MQQIFVSEADLARVREGEIGSLIRFGVKDITGGPLRMYSGCSGETVNVHRIRVECLGRLETDDFRRAGYRSAADFELAWTPHGVHLKDSYRLTIIDFELQ